MKKLICYIVITVILFISIYFVPSSGKSNVEKSTEKISWHAKFRAKFVLPKGKRTFKAKINTLYGNVGMASQRFRKSLREHVLPIMKNMLPSSSYTISTSVNNFSLALSILDELTFELKNPSHKFNDFIWIPPYNEFIDEIDVVPLHS